VRSHGVGRWGQTLEEDVSANTGSAGGSDPIAANATATAAVLAAGLVLLTGAYAYSQRGSEAELLSPREVAHSREAMVTGSGRCALYHARFGGQRAQLIVVTKGSVRTYIVMEVGKRDPTMRSLRSKWLKANYGDAEHVWLGEYGSADAALARAVRLCPPASRCWPGDTDCGRQAQTLTPAQMFFGR
jgi:hypothetical protein